jgi:hypothetical protein
MSDELSPNRLYGGRYVESAADDLYVVAGRILSDLKADQRDGRFPPSAAIFVEIVEHAIRVRVHIRNETDYADHGPESTRAQVQTVCQRYNWIGRRNQQDRRYQAIVDVRLTRARIDTRNIGSLFA